MTHLQDIWLLQKAYYLMDDLMYELYHPEEDNTDVVNSVTEWMRDAEAYGVLLPILVDEEDLDDED